MYDQVVMTKCLKAPGACANLLAASCFILLEAGTFCDGLIVVTGLESSVPTKY